MTIITGDYTYGSDNISLLDFTHKYKVKIGKFCLIYIYIYEKIINPKYFKLSLWDNWISNSKISWNFQFDSEKIMDIYLYVNKNDSFKEYITNKYPKIIFKNIKDYDYYINCTIYDRDFDNLDNNNKSVKRYISHEITERLKTSPNVYFLSPLSKDQYIYTDVLPYSKDKKYQVFLFM